MTARVIAIAHKEAREFLRDPIYLGLAFIAPVVLMVLFGYGLTMDVKHLPIVFLDHDRTTYSRDYMDSFLHSEYFSPLGIAPDRKAADKLLRSGRARLVIDIPPDFSRLISKQKPVQLGVTVDGSFPSRAQVMVGYVNGINRLYNSRLLSNYLAKSVRSGSTPAMPVSVNFSVWYNPSLESKNFIVPGMQVIVLMLFPAILGALLIVRERETGTIFNLIASPAKRWEILAGKAIPYITVAFLDYLITFAMSIFLFKVRFIGSFLFLSCAALLYSTCTIGIGLVFSVIARTQLVAMLITFLATITPAFNYSGFLAPVASQDQVGQFVAHLIPATYFMDMVRGTYLKGLGFAFYWQDLVALALYAIVIYTIALTLFRKRID